MEKTEFGMKHSKTLSENNKKRNLKKWQYSFTHVKWLRNMYSYTIYKQILYFEKVLKFACGSEHRCGSLLMKWSKEGFSEIRTKVVTQDVERWDHAQIWWTEVASRCLRCVHIYILCIHTTCFSWVWFCVQLVFPAGKITAIFT